LQRPETFGRNVDRILEWRPERVALYSFAHLPWLKKNQDLLDSSQLPAPETKLEIFVGAMEKFLAAGYRKIGMDHFAVPEDDLARALDEHRLFRNFMGYTVRPTNAAIGFGVTSIGDLQGSMMQNTKKLNRYYEALGAGRPTVERGFRATKDDLIRRDVIQGIMCNGFVDFAVVEATHGIDAGSYFETEQAELTELESNGFVCRQGKVLRVTELGQMFLRNVAMTFDVYLRRKSGKCPRFSRTV
jgi:oxygen-independent coproporphyrinogen-3 oxidase